MRCFKILFLTSIAIPTLTMSIARGRFSDVDFRFELDMDDVEAELLERNEA